MNLFHFKQRKIAIHIYRIIILIIKTYDNRICLTLFFNWLEGPTFGKRIKAKIYQISWVPVTWFTKSHMFPPEGPDTVYRCPGCANLSWPDCAGNKNQETGAPVPKEPFEEPKIEI